MGHNPGCEIADRFYCADSYLYIDYCKYFDISVEKFFEHMLHGIFIIHHSNSLFILSEHKLPPIQSYIIR